MMGQPEHDTGLPADRSYLECGLPDFLRESIAQMQAAWDLSLIHISSKLRTATLCGTTFEMRFM